ncbi:response regulator [Nakamurella endophytica]|uniref:DNA-binding response regulator n=1 Tax=Nakamurella endophytica TaxID=1748367 RepID=A0A917SYL2_9ACTN|nr:response regulator transcription factor [Nakamurella endophytica]GGM02767.1 DNA-binding response regulator [Nakamurella endophytica]
MTGGTDTTGAGPIRVALVDDQHLVRGGFRMLIDAQPDMAVVGEAEDGRAALHLVASLRHGVDVVLMDVRMPRLDGVAATRELVAASRDGRPRVLVLTTFDLDEYVHAALRAGASGFLLKDARPEELLGAIRAVARGDAVVAPSATRRLLDAFAGRLPDPSGADAGRDPLAELTDREREVLVEVAGGATNAEIADRLSMAEGTVKTHVGRLLAKLQCRDRVALVLVAHRAGLAGRH